MHSTFVGNVYKLTVNWLLASGQIQFEEDNSNVKKIKYTTTITLKEAIRTCETNTIFYSQSLKYFTYIFL